jgi:Tol biopolymer transport system component
MNGDMIFLVNPNSGRKTRRVPAPAVVNCGAPAWSPDGRQFALVCVGVNTPTDPRYLPGVYVMNVDGSDLRRVVEDTDASSPTWSPDGTRSPLPV